MAKRYISKMKKYRIFRDMTREELADKSNLSVFKVSSLERSRHLEKEISYFHMLKLCDALNVKPEDLIETNEV